MYIINKTNDLYVQIALQEHYSNYTGTSSV